MTSRVPRPRGQVVRREIAGETILVPVRGRTADMQRIFSLNPTAAFVWGLIDGVRGFDAIVDAVVAEFEVGRETAAADLELLLAQAAEAGLLEEAE